MRKEFRVSTKAAIFNPDKSKVIAIYINQDEGWGLPGGHIEQDENPDDALIREIREECSITPNKILRADFFIHNDGKLILAYTGTSNNAELASGQDPVEGTPKWLTKNEFKEINIEPHYRQFVLANWE